MKKWDGIFWSRSRDQDSSIHGSTYYIVKLEGSSFHSQCGLCHYAPRGKIQLYFESYWILSFWNSQPLDKDVKMENNKIHYDVLESTIRARFLLGCECLQLEKSLDNVFTIEWAINRMHTFIVIINAWLIQCPNHLDVFPNFPRQLCEQILCHCHY